ncbi:peptidase MA family metallohydrolase [Dehalobacterium formicoaceticum]|uniref:Peptidase MA-like domain-containing protein n=1 Tax=Dehalobacterium formicoaceticum TaxID=51515 RepID=A0ABT1Y3P6_9FIRM|nr:hypothetical protein [Dehalobacterium formicoaceticum]MCR6545496.1 hypothetical protein [Dehalobacterium formicoaceticum]
MIRDLFFYTGGGVKFLIKGIIAAIIVVIFLTVKYPYLPKVMTYKVFREYARISMNWETRHWQELAGGNFVLRFQPGDENVAKLVLATAEAAYAPVNERMSFSPGIKIPIILYPDNLALNKSFGWPADERAMGVYWAGVIRVLSPNAWIQEEDLIARFQSEGPIPHEYTHFIVDYLAGGNYPRWLTEGIAQRVEREITGYEMPLTGTEAFYPLGDMDDKFDLLPNQSVAYRQSLALVDFFVQTYGEGPLNQVLQELGHGQSMDQAFLNSIGCTMKDFEAQFLRQE